MSTLEYEPTKIRSRNIVACLLTIPVVATTVCVAYATTRGAEMSTISAMVDYSRDLEIVFGINMGASIFCLTFGLWILKWRITGNATWPIKPAFVIANVGMAFGCGALARFTLSSDKGTHILYAGIAFVSQWCMMFLLCVWGWYVLNQNVVDSTSPLYIYSRSKVVLSALFTASALICMVLFAASFTKKPYLFEYGLIISLWLSSITLNEVQWQQVYNNGADSGSSGTVAENKKACVFVGQSLRPETRFGVM